VYSSVSSSAACSECGAARVSFTGDGTEADCAETVTASRTGKIMRGNDIMGVEE
jgi:hypothetical protein